MAEPPVELSEIEVADQSWPEPLGDVGYGVQQACA
jgi:hypothetical protein